MLARTCISDWQGLNPGRYRSIHSPQPRGRNLPLGGFCVGESRFWTLKWTVRYAKSNSLFVGVHNKEVNLDSDCGASSSRSVCCDGAEASLRENVAVGSVLNGLSVVNRSLDYVTAAEPGVGRLGRSSASSLSVEGAGVVPLDRFREDYRVSSDGEAPGSDLGLDNAKYYVPEIGHRVLGVVVSGSRTKLDIDIGAAQLGELKVSQLFPLDRFQVKHNKWICPEEINANGARGKFSRSPYGRPCLVYDEEVFGFEDPSLFIIDLGTVLELVVIGVSFSGNPVVSARRAAQRVAWNRVKQIKELNQPIQVEIIDCNTNGVLTKVEGLRAFLPLKEFINRPITLEEYIGRKIWVIVTFVDEGCHSLIISERKAWVKRNLQPGSLHDGTVIEVLPYGVRVQVNRTNIIGLIHISNIAHALIEKVTGVFEVGEQIKMMVVNSYALNTISFSTVDLESEQGLMLRDKQRVFQEAERTAHAWWVLNQRLKEPKNDTEDICAQVASEPIANLEWLDFGGNRESSV